MKSNIPTIASRLALTAMLLGACFLVRSAHAVPLSTAFTYQGQLTDGGGPANGSYDLRFILYSAEVGGSQFGPIVTSDDIAVSNGLFTVPLDFGAGVFTGEARWLEIAVRAGNSTGGYTTLTRQPITAAPSALYAPTAGSAAGLSCSGCVTASNLATGAVTGNSIAGATIQQSNLAFTPVLSVGASAPLTSSGGQTPSISLSGIVALGNGGTGAGTAAGARANLGAASSGANSDITSLSGITDVDNNTRLGLAALSSNTTGTYNTASGAGALQQNTTGYHNTATGADALRANTAGILNTAAGASALEQNTTGSSNTATGSRALFANTTGNFNSAAGVHTLEQNTTGSRNTATGYLALYENTTGIGNTAAGYTALRFNTAGSNNTALGNNAGGSLTSGSNNLYIANSGSSTESGTIRIGTSGTQTRTFVSGIRGVTTGSTNGIAVLIDSNGQLGTVSSSHRFKTAIQDMDAASSPLLKLRPVTFQYRPELDPSGSLQYGLIAEEVERVMPDLVAYGQDGKPESVKYHLLAALLLNELQKQAQEIASLTDQVRRVDAQVDQIESLRERLMNLEAAMHTQKVSSPLKNASLILRRAQHERESPCGTGLSAHPEPVEGRAESHFQQAVRTAPQARYAEAH